MTPSENQEALLHINDVRFGSAGKNVLCMSCISADPAKTSDAMCAESGGMSNGYRTDLKNNYATKFLKSDNISAFMTVIFHLLKLPKNIVACILILKSS